MWILEYGIWIRAMCNLLPLDNRIFPNQIHHEGAVANRVNGKHNKKKHSYLIEWQSKLHTLVDCRIIQLSLTLQFCQISFKRWRNTHEQRMSKGNCVSQCLDKLCWCRERKWQTMEVRAISLETNAYSKSNTMDHYHTFKALKSYRALSRVKNKI